MKKQISNLVDKVLTKGMALMESERVQNIMASPQAQKAMDLGMAALTKIQSAQENAKSCIAQKLDLATRKEVDELREQLEELESRANANNATEKSDDSADHTSDSSENSDDSNAENA